MAARFYYQDFEKTESTEAYLRSQILGVADKNFKDGRYALFVRTTGQEDNYLCEVRLDLPNVSPLFLSEEGSDFFQTVKTLGEAFENKVARI